MDAPFAPAEAIAPRPAAAADPTAPPNPPRPLWALVNRSLVESSPADSPWDRPCSSVLEAALDDPCEPDFPPSSPCSPPWAASPCLTAAPEDVPGSTKASSLNRAIGAKQLMRIRMTPGSAVPIAAWVLSARPLATPVVIWIQMPRTRIIRTGVNAAAWNQRRLFQNQERPASATSPAAEIGVVADRTISAPPRVSM